MKSKSQRLSFGPEKNKNKTTGKTKHRAAMVPLCLLCHATYLLSIKFMNDCRQKEKMEKRDQK